MMNSSLYRMALMFGLMMTSVGGNNNSRREELTEEEIKELRRKFNEQQRRIKLKDGLRVFQFNGFEIIALNEKNAIRKAKNLGIIP